jgi:hypothetical protein
MGLWSNILQTGGVLGSAGLNYLAADQAASAQSDAAQQANELRRAIYQQNRADMAPYRAAGYGALDQQAELLLGNERMRNAQEGVSDAYGKISSAQDQLERLREQDMQDTERYNTIQNRIGTFRDRYKSAQDQATQIADEETEYMMRTSPGYQFRLDQGVQARDRAAAARGMSLSGRQQKELERFGQGLASQEYGNRLNRLAGLAGTGQTATSNTASLGANYAQGAGQNMLRAANARGSSYLTGADQAGRAFNNLYDIWG